MASSKPVPFPLLATLLATILLLNGTHGKSPRGVILMLAGNRFWWHCLLLSWLLFEFFFSPDSALGIH